MKKKKLFKIVMGLSIVLPLQTLTPFAGEKVRAAAGAVMEQAPPIIHQG
ncbi:hypothetical protein M3603_01365 [Rummeliibacillus stabekisii]|nr:hypothetical protein [Rummeliibacillus stabekisii]MCM3315307.1 hypothetical protein [Rummeliibacillus stabekisii]